MDRRRGMLTEIARVDKKNTGLNLEKSTGYLSNKF